MNIWDVEGTISGTVLKVISNIIQFTEGNYQIIPSVVFKVIADLLIKKIPITYLPLRLITTSIDSYHLFKELLHLSSQNTFLHQYFIFWCLADLLAYVLKDAIGCKKEKIYWDS